MKYFWTFALLFTACSSQKVESHENWHELSDLAPFINLELEDYLGQYSWPHDPACSNPIMHFTSDELRFSTQAQDALPINAINLVDHNSSTLAYVRSEGPSQHWTDAPYVYAAIYPTNPYTENQKLFSILIFETTDASFNLQALIGNEQVEFWKKITLLKCPTR